jgi:uncharacterized protein (DUF2235 family)
MVKRIALFFDGTWDRPSDDPDPSTAVDSNVVRLFRSVAEGPQADGATQVKWYDTGVGTNWYDRIGGGAFGFGLDEKIRDGYTALVSLWPDPDQGCQAFLFGFSRGAYTARSLIGMIRNVGLLTPGNLHRLPEAYELYRRRDASADTPEAVAFRNNYSREIGIHFIGVWDTVGALGIPLPALQWLNAAEYAFHDTELSGIVLNAVHALAVDEHRVDYQASLWKAIPKPGQSVEQRWFAGAHCDVGGGYADRRLSNIALGWMQRRALKCALVLDPGQIMPFDEANQAGPVNDSYGAFLDGLYADTHQPYYRPIDVGAGSTQTVDASVVNRLVSEPAYRPKNQMLPGPDYVPPDWL